MTWLPSTAAIGQIRGAFISQFLYVHGASRECLKTAIKRKDLIMAVPYEEKELEVYA